MHWVLPFLGLTGRLSVFVSDSTISTLAKRDAIVNVNLNAKRQIPAMASNQPDDFKWQEGADVFTPLDLVQLPRPGAGVANDAGDLVLVPVSQYSSQDKENSKFVYIATVEAASTPLQIPLAKGGDTFWLDTRTVANVVSGGEGKPQELYAIPIQFESSPNVTLSTSGDPTLIGTFPNGVTVQNFRYTPTAGRLVFSAYVYSDVNLTSVKEQDEAWDKRGNSAFVYDDTFVRHWDTWRTPKRSSLFTVALSKDTDQVWHLGEDYTAPLKDTQHYVPVEPFGGTDDFDISNTHIVYTTKDPQLPPAWHTKQNIYLVDFAGKNAPRELTSGKQGATHSPVFSKSGKKVAWTELDEDGYESDRAKVVIYDLEKDVRFTITQNWDRSPDSLAFSEDDTKIYLTAGEQAHVKAFSLTVPETPSSSTTHPKLPSDIVPVALTHLHAVSSIQPLSSGRLLFTQNSFQSPNNVFVLRNLDSPQSPLQLDQITRFAEESLNGKGLDPGENFWFEGAEGKQVQGWALRPKGWKEGQSKKYPVVLLIHGGPQGAWQDQWSTRWNPNVFAQQGYFTIAINPTGSTTFGQEFTDAITKDWGGKPFVDLQKGWKFVLKNYPEIDPERAVAAGASWGGYAINWIQGHPEYGFGFKAVVCHDGVFDSNYNGFSTDELFFFNHDFGGRPFDESARPTIAKFSPSNYVEKWSIPQLLIHGSKDYRLPETEGIGAFHALQQLGIRSRLVIFPDENHWVLNHGNSLKWHYEVFRWFDEFVGAKATSN